MCKVNARSPSLYMHGQKPGSRKSIKNKMKSAKSKAVLAIGIMSAVILPAFSFVAFAATDTIPPTVSITAPASGATVSGTVTVTATSTDTSIPATDCVITVFGIKYDVTPLQTGHTGGNVFVCGADQTALYQGMHGTDVTRLVPYLIPAAGVAKVELYVDGALAQTDTAAPYTFSWNTTSATNGSHTLTAKAYDLANNNATSAGVTITVNNAAADTSAPTVPTGLTATGFSSSQINLSWTASTDNVAVTGYNVYRGGTKVGTSATANYSDTGLTASTTYSYYVNAYDAAGNTSATSSPASATTLPATTGGGTSTSTDNNAPTVSILSPATGLTIAGKTLIRTSSSDNVKVAKVEIYLDGALAATSYWRPFSFMWNTAATADGSHTLQAKAYDAAGNMGASSVTNVTVQNSAPITGIGQGHDNNDTHELEKKQRETERELLKKQKEADHELQKQQAEQQRESAKQARQSSKSHDSEENDD